MTVISGTGLLAGTAGAAHAGAAPFISASSSGGTFHVTGSGFTAGRTNVAVWLIDFTTNETLFWKGDVQASTPHCGRTSCSLGGLVSVPGWSTAPNIIPSHQQWDFILSCHDNIRVIAKDGDFNDPAAAWSNLSDNIALLPCPWWV